MAQTRPARSQGASVANVVGMLGAPPQPPPASAAEDAFHIETFKDPAPLGMTFTEAFHKDTAEMYIHLGQIRPGSQAATRGLVEGMRLIQVDDWHVIGASYDDVVAHMKRRPVTLHFNECEAGKVLHGAPAAAAEARPGWQVLCGESARLREAMAAAVTQSNAMLGISAPDRRQPPLNVAQHEAVVDATLEKLRARMDAAR
jgi:hypothetical protein